MNAQIEDRQTTPMPPPPSADALEEQTPETPSDAEIRRQVSRELTAVVSGDSLVITVTGQVLRDALFCAESYGETVSHGLLEAIVAHLVADMEAAGRMEKRAFYDRAQDLL